MSIWSNINGVIIVESQCSEGLVEELKQRYRLGKDAFIFPFLPFKALIDAALGDAPKICGSEGNAEFKTISELEGVTVSIDMMSVGLVDCIRLYVGAALRDSDSARTTDEFIRWLEYMTTVFHGAFNVSIEYLCIKDRDGINLFIHEDKIIEAKDGVAEKIKPLLGPEEDWQ